MLEGLEANEQRLSDLGSTARIDSEFFRKHYLVALDKASNANAQTLEDVSSAVIHPTEVERVYSDTGIQILLAQNVRDNIFDFSNEAFMPDAMRSILAANLVQYDDVVLTRSGANYGQCACFKHRWPIYACADVLVIRPRNIAGGYLCTFLNTSYGKALVERGAYGAAQPHVAPPYLRSLPIPRFPGLEDKVDKVIQASVDVVASGRKIYAEAETLLLRSLGLEDWQPPEPLAYESTFSQAWGDGRLDAEHFQPKYAALMAHMERHAPRCRRVGDFASYCDRGAQPLYDEDGTLAVVNSRHILETGLDYDNFERADASLWDRPDFSTSRIQYGDILVYTTGANIGRTAVYLEQDPALASNHVNLVRVTGENPVYVGLVLNSLIGRMQTRRDCTGSAQVEIYPSDIRNFVVPFVPEETQGKITAAVEAAHVARKRAKGLLEAAKRAVEVAIEDGEASGMAVLEGLREKWV